MSEILNLTLQIKKSGLQTYMNEDEESLVVASAEIEGGDGLPLDCRGVAKQFQRFVKDNNSQCSDNNIQKQSSLSYFQESIKRVNKK